MSTRWESYCNTTTDLMAVAPDIDTFDRKRALTGFALVSGTTFRLGNAGYVERLWRNGIDLGAAQATVGAVDADGEWFYDSTTDLLTICSTNSPSTTVRILAGRLWATIKTEAVARASEFVRQYVGKPIYPRPAGSTTGLAESERAYDDTVIQAAAYLACAYLIQPYDLERSTVLMRMAYDPSKQSPGLLDMIKAGEISLWNEVTRAYNTGIVRKVAVASDSAGPLDFIGEATTTADLIKIKIITGGTFTEGTASTVTYSVWVGDTTGLKTSQVVTAAVVDGSYQPLAHGIYGRFSPGKYTANDEWELEVRGGAPEVGQPTMSVPIRRV